LTRRIQNALAAILALLLVACVIAAYVTGGQRSQQTAATQAVSANSLVDQRLLQTAQQMDAIADTAAERTLASEALRLSDHELDQAFASMLREAAQSSMPATGPLKTLNDRIKRLKAQIAVDQERIARLAKQGDSDDQLELAKAQLALDQDDLEDAQQDLARAGGDRHATIERAIQEHESAQHKPPQQVRNSAAARSDTLGEQVQVWFSLGRRESQLDFAQKQAADHAAALGKEHDSLEKSSSGGAGGGQDTAATVSRLHHLADQRKELADLDKRIQDSQQLGNVYARWGTEVAARRTQVLHLLLRSLAAVFAILLAMMLINRAIHRAFGRHTDPRRLHQLRVMSTIAVQVVAVSLILIIVFGPPNQISTIIGLATAGLTLVLKDFILAFFGWFALAGRNGIRIGDWVEIRGVGGEVVEIGLMKTVLLEMGNWTSTGHPTGRRVSFMNSFAMEGHYFNFSTGGQWLWDELQVTLPATSDPYRLAQQIREIVERATETDAQEAEKDWERVTRQYGMRPFSAKPAVDLRPSVNGLEVNVRYITRAPQRYVVKSRLFEAIVGLLHKSPADSTTELSRPTSCSL
jgi:small-conductance mechanosensitive channel